MSGCTSTSTPLVIDHSDNKAHAAPTWKKTVGHHPLPAFVDRHVGLSEPPESRESSLADIS